MGKDTTEHESNTMENRLVKVMQGNKCVLHMSVKQRKPRIHTEHVIENTNS